MHDPNGRTPQRVCDILLMFIYKTESDASIAHVSAWTGTSKTLSAHDLGTQH